MAEVSLKLKDKVLMETFGRTKIQLGKRKPETWMKFFFDVDFLCPITW